MDNYQIGKDIGRMARRLEEIERRIRDGACVSDPTLIGLGAITLDTPPNEHDIRVSAVETPNRRLRIATDYESYVYEWDNNGGGTLRRVTVSFDTDFSREQIDFLKTAISYWIARPFSDQPCVRRNGSTFRRDRSLSFPYTLPYDLEEFLVMNMTIFWSTYVARDGGPTPGPRQALFIDRISVPPNGNSWLLGQAGLNYYDTFGHLHIELNEQAIGSSSSYSRSQDRVHWAGVVVHETLHNLGFDHADASDANYNNAFMVAYQRCYTGDASVSLTSPDLGICGNRQQIFPTTQSKE